MKFKHLIIVFNGIIIFILLTALLMPLLLLKPGFPANPHLKTLPILLFMVFLLISMNIFFFINYRLLLLLEREDWPALAFYLENEIYTKGRYSNRKVRLLVSSYLVLSDYPSIIRLEGRVLSVKPSIVDKNILNFGIARLLGGSHAEAAAFFKAHIGGSKGKDSQWARWFYGFSQLLCGDFKLAEQEFLSLAVSSENAFITGLSAYFLQGSIARNSDNAEECRTVAENGRKRVLKAYCDLEKWQEEAGKIRTDVFVSIIMKYIDEAGKWLYQAKV